MIAFKNLGCTPLYSMIDGTSYLGLRILEAKNIDSVFSHSCKFHCPIFLLCLLVSKETNKHVNEYNK